MRRRPPARTWAPLDWIDLLAIYRLARLVTEDSLTFNLREKGIAAAYKAVEGDTGARLGTWRDQALMDGDLAPKMATLLVCPWCASFWLAAGALALRRLAPRLWRTAAQALAASAVAGLVAHAEHAVGR